MVSRLRLTLKTRLGEWLDESSWAGQHVAVAFSGGRDSLALLHALAVLRADNGFQLSAIHVHHGLSPHADRWAAFAENFCKLLDVPLTVVRVRVLQGSGLGVEAAARAERYRAFSDCAADLVLLAHHQDDQAETLLFNLLRGAGAHGAAAMPTLRRTPRSMGGALLLGRPWLDVSRTEIDAYVAACGLIPIDDESNLDQRFSRNHLRHEILPRLTARYPKASSSLANAARRFGEAAGLLDTLADIDLAIVKTGDCLDWTQLTQFGEIRQRNILRRWLALSGESISSEAALVEFLRQCRDASVNASVAMSFGALSLRRWQGRLYRVAEAAAPEVERRVWAGESSVAWGNGVLGLAAGVGDGLKAAALMGEVELRSRQGNEVIRLRANGPSRLVRLLFQERAVPPWERPLLPFLWVDGRLAAVGGVGIAADFQALGGEPSISFDWRPF